jgi:hypothetical protein
MSKLLFLLGSVLFSMLGLAHALLTIRDLRTPRSFAPTDDNVRLAMVDARLRLAPQTTIWRSWLGFNLSHSLGLMVFGGLLTGIALRDFDFVAHSAFLKGSSVVVAVLYFWMAVRFWFWLPATLSAVGAACFVLSALSGWVDSS